MLVREWEKLACIVWHSGPAEDGELLLLLLAAGGEAGRSDAEDASVRVSESGVVVVVFA